MTSKAPSSCMLTEAKLGKTSHALIKDRRWLTLGTIQAPVLTPTGVPGHAAWMASSARATSSGARLSCPSEPRT